MNNKIDVRNFNFYYGASQALIDLNLPVRENQITALIGPSGCGKSTFLRSLNRMNDTIRGTRATGEVLLDGKNVYDPDVDVVDLRQRVGMVFQRPNPFPQSIYDNVAFGPRVLGTNKKGDLDAIVEASLQSASLWDEVRHRLNEPAFDLNPGQQQRLCIARTIAVKPEVILMDEPCSALDPVATLRVEDLMRVLAQTIHDCDCNPQHAAGGPGLGLDGLLLVGPPGGVRPNQHSVQLAQGRADGSLHHRPAWLTLQVAGCRCKWQAASPLPPATCNLPLATLMTLTSQLHEISTLILLEIRSRGGPA